MSMDMTNMDMDKLLKELSCNTTTRPAVDKTPPLANLREKIAEWNSLMSDLSSKAALSGPEFKIQVSPILPLQGDPKLKLSKQVMVSDEFRSEMDAWLLGVFGCKPPIHMFITGGSSAVVSRDLYLKIKQTGVIPNV